MAGRTRARDLCHALNATRETEADERRRILGELFGAVELGERVFFNFNCIALDVCRVQIGSFTLFGPAMQIDTATHPFNAGRCRREESGKPVHIGSDVWVGGGAIILPGECPSKRASPVRAFRFRWNRERFHLN